MKHFGIYASSGDVQTALNESALTNPYVALVSGALDYNTITPASNYIGEWSDDGQGVYTFQILDAESFTLGDIEIATSELYFNGDLTNMLFFLNAYDVNDGLGFKMCIYPEGGDSSDGVENEFTGADSWAIQEIRAGSGGQASDGLAISFDGAGTFTFEDYSGGVLSINTINPEAPAGE